MLNLQTHYIDDKSQFFTTLNERYYSNFQNTQWVKTSLNSTEKVEFFAEKFFAFLKNNRDHLDDQSLSDLEETLCALYKISGMERFSDIFASRLSELNNSQTLRYSPEKLKEIRNSMSSSPLDDETMKNLRELKISSESHDL